MGLLKTAIYYFAMLLNMLILVRCFLSWMPISKDNSLIKILFMLTDPIITPIRKLVERSPLGGSGMMIDFSPFIASIIILFVSNFIIGLL